MIIPHDALMVAVDGARRSLSRNSGADRELKQELLTEEERKAPSTAEMGDDRPARAFQSGGRTRGAFEATDLHQQQEDEFSEQMAELFNFHMNASQRGTILIAPPAHA